MSTLSRVVVAVTLLVNLGDIVLHIAINMVEPLRIAGNVIVLLAIALLTLVPRLRHPAIAGSAGGLSVVHLAFIAQFGIGTLGALLVAATTLLMLALALSLRTARMKS